MQFPLNFNEVVHMDRIAVFIDGGYLDYVKKYEFNGALISYPKLTDWIADGIDVLRTYYYHYLPYQSNPPTEEERKRFSKAQSFFEALKKYPRYEVRLGKLEFRGLSQDGRPIFEQKRVDILLGVDMVMLASKQRITHAAIITGDSDFLPAIRAAKQEGVITKLYYSKKYMPHDDLFNEVDERIAITPEVVKNILMG